MDVKVNSEKQNGLLDRKEIELSVSFDKATPNKKDLRYAISQKLGLAEENVVIRNISNQFGVKEISITAHIYPKPEILKKNEPHHVLVRSGVAEKKPKKVKEKKAPAKKKQ